MRILHFLSHFSLLSETFIYDEILALEKLFPGSNQILTFERHLGHERPFPNVNVVSRTPSFAQKLHRRFLKVFKGVNIPRQHFPICAYLSKHLDSFDIIEAHFGWNAIVLWQALKALDREKQKPILVRCHGSDISQAPVLNPVYQKQLLEFAASSNVLLTANSDFLTGKMISLGIDPAKIHRVANTFNQQFLACRKKHYFQPGDCLKLINTARFVEWKGQKYLVKGFARFVREVYPNSLLTLIGEGETLAQVKHIAEQEGVSDKVKFLGGLPHRDIAMQLSEHDIYIQPSIIDLQTLQEESFGVVLLEALAVGLPLVITRTGGMPEIVGENNPHARIIPEQDPAAICHALEELVRMGISFQDISAFNEKKLAAFSPEMQMRDLQSAYSKLLRNSALSATA